MIIAYVQVIKDICYDYTPKLIMALYFQEIIEDVERYLNLHLTQKENQSFINQVDLAKMEEATNIENEVEKIQKALALLEGF